LERAEAAVAHLERQYDELNAVVIVQGREIERLRRALERLGETLETQELDRVRSTQTKPPHYSV
jgi:uncharacterized coiled-coil protein SlyX